MIPELKTFLIAMSPIVELRGSIPVALGVYHLPIWSAYFFSILGNIVPVLFLLKALGPISDYFSHHFYFCNRFFAWLFAKTRRDHTSKFQRFKEFALVVLVAIPLPFTGAWTGSICAFVFGIPFWRALFLITIGVMIAGIVVTSVTLGIINFVP